MYQRRTASAPAVGDGQETPVGVEPTRSCFAGSRHTVWHQRQVGSALEAERNQKCPCQESNLVYELRRLACLHHTPRTNGRHLAPRDASSRGSETTTQQECKESNPAPRFWRPLASQKHTPNVGISLREMPRVTEG